MNTLRRGAALLLTTYVLAGCGLFGGGGGVTVGSGRVTSETRPVSDFTNVVLDGQGQVTLVQGADEALTIEAEDNLLPLITSTVQDGTLRLGFNRATWADTIRPTEPIRFRVVVRDLRALDLSGSGSFSAASLRVDELVLRLPGTGDITVDQLEAAALDVRLDGTGTVTLAGQVGEQVVGIGGSGQYAAGDLDSQTAQVTISGTGDAVVWVRADLAAHISGTGTISYWGAPDLSRRDISGTGDINPMGVK